MKFTKMESYGNDYVYINNINEELSNLPLLAKFISNRHFGVGSDGMILICKSTLAEFKMRVFNPDGTEAEMCGNALRGVGKFVYDHNLTDKTKFSVETLGGIKKIELEIKDDKIINIKANIGSPIFDPKLIPVNTNKNKFILESIEILDKTFKMSSLSWGNPHTVIFVDNVEYFDIKKYGNAIENKLDIFPNKTNVTFAQIIDYNTVRIREWERGTGETLGCATGCSSAVVISHMLGLTSNKCNVLQIGGAIEIEYKDNELFMKGPSTTVFEGEIDISLL